MTTFEYLGVLFSVVVGLAVTRTLRGLLRVVHHRKTIVVSWPALVWTAAILQWTLFFWWFSGLDLARLEAWRFTTLLFVLAYGSALFFLLGLLHPDDAGPDFDMRAHFEGVRPWFFGVFLGRARPRPDHPERCALPLPLGAAPRRSGVRRFPVRRPPRRRAVTAPIAGTNRPRTERPMRYAPLVAVLWMACATTPGSSGDGDPVECLTRALRQDYVVTAATSDPGLVTAERRSEISGRETDVMWVLTFRILDDGAIEPSVEEGRALADRPGYVQSRTRASEEDFATALARRCSRTTM